MEIPKGINLKLMMINESNDITNSVVQLVLKLYKNADVQSLNELETSICTHFDDLNLSELRRALKDADTYNFFNGCMALLNKYRSFKKDRIPFELDLHDYVLADKITKSLS